MTKTSHVCLIPYKRIVVVYHVSLMLFFLFSPFPKSKSITRSVLNEVLYGEVPPRGPIPDPFTYFF